MNYYTYKLTLKRDPRYYYYGVHRTERLPEEDRYFGSGRGIQELKQLYGSDCFEKEILSIQNSRKESLIEEEKLVGNLWKTDPFCLNRMPGGAFKSKFDTTGLITYHKGNKVRYIRPESTRHFEEQGWIKGIPESRAETIRRYITVSKGGTEKRILPEDLGKWEQESWVKGRADKYIQELKSRIPVTDGVHSKSIHSGSLQHYLNQGWKIGHSGEHTKRSAEWNKGTVYVFRNGVSTKVKKENLQKYLNDGWQKGNLATRKPRSQELRELSRKAQKGRIWIKKGTECKKIWPSELKNYPDWERGRLSTPDTTGYRWINNGQESRTVKLGDLQKYLDTGWQKGKGFKVGSTSSLGRSTTFKQTPLYLT